VVLLLRTGCRVFLNPTVVDGQSTAGGEEYGCTSIPQIPRPRVCAQVTILEGQFFKSQAAGADEEDARAAAGIDDSFQRTVADDFH